MWWIVLGCLVIALPVVGWLVARRAADSPGLAAFARLVDGELDHGDARVQAALQGHEITVENFANETSRWSELSARGVAPGLDLDLRPRTDAETRAIDAGRAVDVDLGDPGFRDAFVAEGAPAAAIRAMFDAELRRLTRAAAPTRLTLRDGALRVVLPHPVQTEADARALHAFAIALLRAADAAAPTEVSAAERARLTDARAGRQRRDRTAAYLVLGALALITIIAAIVMIRRHGLPRE